MNPSSHPAHTPQILFSIGTWDVHTYAITMLLGMLASIGTIGYFFWKRGYSMELLELLVIVIIPSSLVGARLWYVMGNITNPDIRNNWYAVWDGGLAIEGGVVVSGLAGLTVVLFNRHQIDWMDAAGIIVPNVLIGQAIGRWGNFANHEVFGHVTSRESVAWLGAWISNNMFIDGSYRVPLFFYESITSLVGWILFVWVMQLFIAKKIKPGVPCAAYFMWYGIVRTSMEPLRDTSDIMRWGSLDVSVLVSVTYIILGIGLLIWFQFLTKRYTLIKDNWVLKAIKATQKIPLVKVNFKGE